VGGWRSCVAEAGCGGIDGWGCLVFRVCVQ
jgi:hypothetical protein